MANPDKFLQEGGRIHECIDQYLVKLKRDEEERKHAQIAKVKEMQKFDKKSIKIKAKKAGGTLSPKEISLPDENNFFEHEK